MPKAPGLAGRKGGFRIVLLPPAFSTGTCRKELEAAVGKPTDV